ncbi:MAG: winged helix-turn-helix domain-containing protein [Methanomassiliicoccales archaeon]|nr:winged helix-turn-helix domain-containing protein [Methanomassiliicoccales archaeon]
MQGKTRRSVLEALEKGPRTPTNIADTTGEHLPHVSRALGELSENGLLKCMTPKSSKNRIYTITEEGRKVLSKLREMG